MLYVILVLLAGTFIALALIQHLSKNPMDDKFFLHPYAHRGLHGKGHAENTLPAFRCALQHGYGIELDVRITGDHHLAVFHDQSALRMCGTDKQIESMSLQEICALRLAGTDAHVPLLTDVLSLVSGQVPLMVELKTPASRTVRRRFIRLVCEAIGDKNRNVCIVSFDPRLLHLMKKQAPHIPRGQLISRGRSMLAALLLAPFLQLYAHPHFLSCQMGSGRLSYKIARLFHPVLAGWTVRSMTEWQAVKHIFDLVVFEAFLPQADDNARPIQKEGNLS